jgi:hypothetical protein
MLIRALAKAGLATGLLGPPVVGGAWYGLAATEPQLESVRDIFHNLPSVLQGGLTRFSRPLLSGLLVGLDYKVSLRGLDDKSEEYQEAISKVGCSGKTGPSSDPKIFIRLHNLHAVCGLIYRHFRIIFWSLEALNIPFTAFYLSSLLKPSVEKGLPLFSSGLNTPSNKEDLPNLVPCLRASLSLCCAWSMPFLLDHNKLLAFFIVERFHK